MAKLHSVHKNRKREKGWREICRRDPAGAQRCWQFLGESADQYVPGKTKIYQGQKVRGLRQYKVNYSDRVLFRIDKETMTVLMEYAGPHL